MKRFTQKALELTAHVRIWQKFGADEKLEDDELSVVVANRMLINKES